MSKMSNTTLLRSCIPNVNKVLRISHFSSKQEVQGNNDISPVFHNRNPRNLEKLRIAYKPSGYHCETPGRDFWHKLVVETTGRHLTAKIVHYTGPTVISASTNEWAIKKYLYRTQDMPAYSNLGRILAQRCLESGLTEIRSDLKPAAGGKMAALLNAIEEGGVALKEAERYMPHRPSDLHRPEKPWEVHE